MLVFFNLSKYANTTTACKMIMEQMHEKLNMSLNGNFNFIIYFIFPELYSSVLALFCNTYRHAQVIILVFTQCSCDYLLFLCRYMILLIMRIMLPSEHGCKFATSLEECNTLLNTQTYQWEQDRNFHVHAVIRKSNLSNWRRKKCSSIIDAISFKY